MAAAATIDFGFLFLLRRARTAAGLGAAAGPRDHPRHPRGRTHACIAAFPVGRWGRSRTVPKNAADRLRRPAAAARAGGFHTVCACVIAAAAEETHPDLASGGGTRPKPSSSSLPVVIDLRWGLVRTTPPQKNKPKEETPIRCCGWCLVVCYELLAVGFPGHHEGSREHVGGEPGEPLVRQQEALLAGRQVGPRGPSPAGGVRGPA